MVLNRFNTATIKGKMSSSSSSTDIPIDVYLRAPPMSTTIPGEKPTLDVDFNAWLGSNKNKEDSNTTSPSSNKGEHATTITTTTTTTSSSSSSSSLINTNNTQRDPLLDEIWATARRKKLKADEMAKRSLKGIGRIGSLSEDDGFSNVVSLQQQQQQNISLDRPLSQTSQQQESQGDRERERERRERMKNLADESIWE
jgi:hypothetical protein